jgi:hypothetical protein
MTTMTHVPAPHTRKHKVNDQYGILEFEGELIGEASTESDRSPRWTEIQIYRTTGGNYVVSRVGVSLVYHNMDATCASGLPRLARDLVENDQRQLEPCDDCQPADLEALPPATRVRVETDRHSAEAVPADKLVQALTLKRANGSTYVSNVAQTALSMALENDPSLIDVLATKTYIP